MGRDPERKRHLPTQTQHVGNPRGFFLGISHRGLKRQEGRGRKRGFFGEFLDRRDLRRMEGEVLDGIHTINRIGETAPPIGTSAATKLFPCAAPLRGKEFSGKIGAYDSMACPTPLYLRRASDPRRSDGLCEGPERAVAGGGAGLRLYRAVFGVSLRMALGAACRVLIFIMGRRYLNTRKAMPALLIVVLSAVVAIVQLYIILFVGVGSEPL